MKMHKKRTKIDMLGVIAKTVAILNLTFIYTSLSGLTGIPFKLIGISFLCVLFLYCAVNARIFKDFASRPRVIAFYVIFIFAPILSVVIAPYFLQSYVGYYLLSGAIFSTCAVWICKDGFGNFGRWLLVSWIIGVIGVVISYFFPGYFERVALMQQQAASGSMNIYGNIVISTENAGRAFGFYMQPNRASLALCFHLVILASLVYYGRPVRRLILTAITLFAILLTGSRGGFLAASVVIISLFWLELVNGVRVGSRLVSGLASLKYYMLLLVVGAGILVGALSLGLRSNTGKSAAGRIVELFSGEVNLSEDSSVRGRLIAQAEYIDQILQSPFIGYGLASTEVNQYMGQLFLSSHNMFLEAAYQFGIPLVLAMFVYIFFYLTLNQNSRAVRRFIRIDVSFALCALFFTACLVSNSVFDYRVFPVVMAVWVCISCFPGIYINEQMWLNRR